MRISYLKGTASFMIALILTLPIYSSVVLAALTNGHLYGETDNVKGYYRRDENINFNIQAEISGDTIEPSQLHLEDLSGDKFNNCLKEDGSFDCSYQIGPNNKHYPTKNPETFMVRLFDDSDNLHSSLPIQGAFDEQAPEIISFDIVPSIVSRGNARFQYDIYDHSYSQADVNRCSGINKIELSHNSVIFNTETINSDPNDCSASGVITVPVSNINADHGTVEVVLTAYDNFNQQASTISQFDYDIQGPIIDLSSLEIKDIQNNLITHIGDAPIPTKITFIIESDDLNVDKVYGDISTINKDAPTTYKNKKATCTKVEEVYICTFTNIEVKLTQSTTVNIIINASDISKNTQAEVLSQNIIYDTTGPSVESIKTDKADNNINYVGALTTLIVGLKEEGVGINKNNIKLDLSNVKSGLNNKAADECSNSGSDWTCYWYNISCDKSDGEATISVSGFDRLNNQITGTLSTNLVIDQAPPAVTSSKVEAKGVGVEAIPGYIKTNDILDVTLNIKEKNKLRAYADFSSFVTTQDNVAGSCTKENEQWTCEFSSSQINVPGHIIGDINFNIKDVAGNTQLYKETIEVLEYEDAVNLTYWTSKVECSPSLVDRQITDLVNARVYCKVALSATTPDQETLSISLGSCTDNIENSLGYIENVDIVNAERSSTEPYLSIDLIKGEMTIDKLSITCPLKIISRVGTKINQNPEIVPIKINIGFYNMPLGEYGDGIESKIQDAKDDAEGIWKIVGGLKKLVSYARLICNVLYTWHKIRLLWQTIVTPELTMAHLSMVGTPVEPTLGAAKAGACVSDKGVEKLSKYFYTKMGDKFCKFINCQMSPDAPSEGSGTFEKIRNSLGRGDWLGLSSEMDKAGTGPSLLPTNWPMIATQKLTGGEFVEGSFEDVYGKKYYQYANARDNLLVALVMGCLPGVINGLEKYRQIQCLYADCVQQNAYNNVLVKLCEDQKAYATCKYITGEIFAFLPWTAFFDYYIGMIRAALADPITAIVTAFNVLGGVCPPPCSPDPASSKAWLKNEAVCRGLQFAALLGEVINNVEGIIDSYDQIKADYCKRI